MFLFLLARNVLRSEGCKSPSCVAGCADAEKQDENWLKETSFRGVGAMHTLW